METSYPLPGPKLANLEVFFRTAMLALFVGVLCYQGDRLAYVLGIPPDQIAAFWPPTPFLVAVLLLTPRKIWPVLVTAGLGALALADLRNGVTVSFEVWITLGNAADVFVATLGLSLLFKGTPQLTSVKSLAKYLAVAVVLAPLASALVGGNGSGLGFGFQWRLWFFADALGFLTMIPAILTWVTDGREWARRCSSCAEFAAMITLLVSCGYLTFVRAGQTERPELLYSLVPLLLWAALRLGLKGVSTSMLVVALMAVWGTAHGHGPFVSEGPLTDVLSLQLFLLFAAMPFMFLSVLVEEQKLARERLSESEVRFRLVANAAPVMIWMSGLNKECSYVNQTWLDFTGHTFGEELLKGWSEGIHPEDRKSCLETYNQAFDQRQPFSMAYRLRRRDGEYRWVLENGVARSETDGSFAGYIGSTVDFTERKKAQDALATVSARLIEAQEKERSRIGRELHDDIVQRLALLVIDLEVLRDMSVDSPRHRAEQLLNKTQEILNDVQTISHQLHSSKLEYLGVVSAMKSFCAEFAEQRKVAIDFTAENIVEILPRDVSLCLFRVLQEAVHNASKHSGVSHFEAQLGRTHNEIQLMVRDSGAGFDLEEAKTRPGLGLISMRERVGLVGGTISIASKPLGGTRIEVSVPIPGGTNSNQLGASA